MNQHLNDSAQRWANSCVGLGDLKVEVKKEEDGELTTGMRSVTLIMPSDDRYPENMAQERDMAVQICKNLNLNLIKQEVKADEVRCLLPAMKSEIKVEAPDDFIRLVSSSHDDDLEPESDSATDADAVADALTDDDEPQAPTFRHKDNCDCPECEEKVFIFGERHKEFHQGTTTAAAVVTANDAHLPLQLQGSSLNPPELLQPEPTLAGPSGNASSSNRPALNNDSSDSDIESEQVRRQRARSNKDIVDARRLAANVTTWPPIPRQRVQPQPQPQTPASASLGVAIAANVNQHVPVPVCVREPQQQPQLPIVTKRRKSLRLMGKAVASKAASKARASRVGVRQSVRLNNATRLLVQQHHRLLQTQHHRQRQTALERGRQIQRHRAQQNHEQIRRDQRRARHQQNPIVQNQNHAIHRHRLACTECTKSFGSKAALDLHQNVHTRRFECQECGKCFQSNALLEIHERIHVGDLPFPCDHCNRYFTQYGNMMRHYIGVNCPNNMN